MIRLLQMMLLDTIMHKSDLCTDTSYLFVTLPSQQNLRSGVLKGAYTKGSAASPTQRTLDDATEPNICDLGQIFSGVQQHVLGLEIHMYQLHTRVGINEPTLFSYTSRTGGKAWMQGRAAVRS